MPFIISADDIRRLRDEVFAENIAAGWYTDLTTGESLIGKRNVGELLMLIVSELCEAAEGYDGDLPDDKLPHRKMFEVELADTAIRIADLGGNLDLDLAGAWEDVRLAPPAFADGLADRDLMRLVRLAAAAMEGHRKGQVHEPTGRPMIEVALTRLLKGCFWLGDSHGLDVMGAIEEKRAFNKTRADHQIENRKAAGGKQY